MWLQLARCPIRERATCLQLEPGVAIRGAMPRVCGAMPRVRWTFSFAAAARAGRYRRTKVPRVLGSKSTGTGVRGSYYDPAFSQAAVENAAAVNLKGLIQLVQDAAKANVTTPSFWLSARAKLHMCAPYFDASEAILALKALAAADNAEASLSRALSSPILRKLRQLNPRQLVDVLVLYASAESRPAEMDLRDVLHVLADMGDHIYGEEFALIMETLATVALPVNDAVLRRLAQAVIRNRNMLSALQCCTVVAAFHSLDVQSQALYLLLDDWFKQDVEAMPIQELLDCLQALPLLSFSWRPFEQFVQEQVQLRIHAMIDVRDVEELADPLHTVDLLKQRDLMDRRFLAAVCKWCSRVLCSKAPLAGSRTKKKPSAGDLLGLHEILSDFGLQDDPNFRQAVAQFVTSNDCYGLSVSRVSRGPLKFRAKRTYFKAADPLEALGTSSQPIPSPEAQFSSMMRAMSRREFDVCQNDDGGASRRNVVAVPPGLTLRTYAQLRALQQSGSAHVGALWNATVLRRRVPSYRDPTVRYSNPKNRKPCNDPNSNRPLIAYTRPASRPLKHPRGWL